MKWMARSAAMAGATLVGWAVYGGSQLDLNLDFPGKGVPDEPFPMQTMADRVVEDATGIKVPRDSDNKHISRKTGRAPKAAEAPKARKAQKARKAAHAAKARQAPKARKAAKARQAPKARKAPKAPRATKARKAPKAPKIGQ